MSLVDKIGLGLLGRLEPERAHAVALRALHGPLVSLPGPATSPVLKTRLVGLELPNPVGLAAGFDKNATALAPLMRAGFGFVEVGAATPRPQRGNPRPRVFRLRRDRAVINRMGFPNDGVDAIVERLAARPKGIPVGLNIGAGKDSPDRARDYAEVLERARPHIDFATVNVSSPNTERLRDLQGRQALAELLAGVMAVRGDVPVFLKIAPDLTDAEVTDIASVALETGVEGLIATNTTVSRGPLRGRRKGEAGGLSGQPLFEPSTRTLARLYRDTGGVIPIIGVGGVSTGREAYEKIRAGASAVQLYTAMVYDGLGVVSRVARDLDILLQHDGFESVEAARGSGVRAWLT